MKGHFIRANCYLVKQIVTSQRARGLRNSSEDKVYVFKDKYLRQMKGNPKKNTIDNKESQRV